MSTKTRYRANCRNMTMPKPQKTQLAEVHRLLKFLVEEVRVNGTDGSEPVTGIQNVLEYHTDALKKLNKKLEEQGRQVSELNTLHIQEWAKRDLRKSFAKFVAASPMLASLAKVITWKAMLLIIVAGTGSWLGIKSGWLFDLAQFIIKHF